MSNPSQTLAAVDLGSNSFHMLLARVENDQLQVIDRHKDMVRLAEGLDDSERITAPVRKRALECLRQFSQPLRNLPSENIRIVGTNTLRRLRDTDGFIDEAEAALGHPIEIISGREEARLIYLGVAHCLPVDGKKRLVIDIGGGSTELIIGRNFDTLVRESLPLGCVRMTKAWFSGGEVKRRNWKQAIYKARIELLPIVANYAQIGWDYGVGSSGTMRSVAAVIQANGWSDGDITIEGVKRLEEAILAVKHIDDLKLEGLAEDRRPVFVGGFAVVRALFDALHLESLRPSTGALREGVLYDLSGRLQHNDVRRRSIEVMIERFVKYPAQAERVRALCIKLLKMTADSCGLKKNDMQMIKWAAQLHDIGLVVAHSGYHKHGAYLVRYADMRGFSQSEQEELALLIRTQRRKVSKSLFEGFNKSDRERLLKMMLVLRLALLLRRDRKDSWVQIRGFTASASKVQLTFGDGWLDQHPLTRFDLEQEAGYLEKLGVELIFK